jgi:hypothetical protein
MPSHATPGCRETDQDNAATHGKIIAKAWRDPLHQNEGLIRALSNWARIVPERMHSIVVFQGNCSLWTEMSPMRITRAVKHVAGELISDPFSRAEVVEASHPRLLGKGISNETLDHIGPD